jgi:hypothetical protein
MNPSKKTAVVIVLVFLLILAGLFVVFKKFSTTTSPTTTNQGVDSPILFGGGTTDPLNGADLGTTTEDGNVIIPKLRRISQNPTAGATIFDTPTETLIRYTERATGHLFETSTTSITQKRIGNTTVPSIQKALWVEEGNAVILQYLNEQEIIKSFYEPIQQEGVGADGVFLRNNLATVSVNKEGNKIFTLTTDGTGYLSNPDGGGESRVFSSPLTGWLAQWSGSNVLLKNKPTNNVDGFLFNLNTKTGTLSKLFSIKGLSALQNDDASQTLFSTSDLSGTTLYVYNNEKELLSQVPFRTLADKCVWTNTTTIYCASPYETPDALYPDAWLQGTVSFSDDLWMFDTKTQTAKLVYNLEAEGRHFDMTHLMVNKAENTLIFIDKKSLMLWSIRL